LKIYYIVATIAISLIFSKHSNAQLPQEKRMQIAMLKFLFDQKELTNPKDTVPSNLDVMFHRAILVNKVTAKQGTIYEFGSYSPHGKRFIGMADRTGVKLLETKDLPADMQSILAFFKRNKVNGTQGYNCLNTIAETYHYNEKKDFRPRVEKN
jgi:hypothetical protein